MLLKASFPCGCFLIIVIVNFQIKCYVISKQPGQNFGGEIVELNHLDEENWLTSFYGMEDFFYSIIEVYKGESDLETLKEKMALTYAPDSNGVTILAEPMSTIRRAQYLDQKLAAFTSQF